MTRLRYIWLVLMPVLLGACGKAVDPNLDPGQESYDGGPVTLTVATCNVLKPSGRRDEMSLDKIAVQQALAKSVRNTGADIIGFNELDETLVSGGRYSLPEKCALLNFTWKLEWPNAPHENNTATYSYANGFAFNHAKLKLEESGYVWLSKDEAETWYVKPASAYKNAGSPARTCVWARMTHKASGKVFWLFVTHLPTDSQGGAYNMAGVLNRFAAQKAGDAPAILTGDMNCSPAMSSVSATAAYRRLTGYWTDGNLTSQEGTMSGSSEKYYYTPDVYTRNHPERRIDHIMTRGCSASGYHSIITTYTAGDKTWCPSDHLPVSATITIK